MNFPGSCGALQSVSFEPGYLAVDPRVLGGEGLLDACRFPEAGCDQGDVAAGQSEPLRHTALDIAREFRSKGVGVHLSCQAIDDSLEYSRRVLPESFPVKRKMKIATEKDRLPAYSLKLRSLGKRLGFTRQVDFAAALRTRQGTLTKWLSGEARPAPEAFVRMASLAKDEEKLFFLRESGIPFSELGEIDLHPGGLARQMREFETKKRGAAPELDIEVLWDPEFMEEVISAVNENLKQAGKTPDDVKYPQLVVAAYNLSYYDRAALRARVKQISKIA